MKYKVQGVKTEKKWENAYLMKEITEGHIGFTPHFEFAHEYFKHEEENVEHLLKEHGYLRFEKVGESIVYEEPKKRKK